MALRRKISRSRVTRERAPLASTAGRVSPAFHFTPKPPRRHLEIGAMLGRLWARKSSKMIALGTALALVISLGSSVMVFASQPKISDGWEVKFDGRSIGVVADKAPIETVLHETLAAYSAQYAMDAYTDQALEFSPVSAQEEFFASPDEVTVYLKAQLQVKVKTTSISVNGKPVVALRTQEEAQTVLDQIIQPYREPPKEGEQRSETTFVEQVEILPQDAPFDEIVDTQQAVQVLSMGTGVQDNWYTVKKGDSYNGLANKNNLTINDICKANPGLDVSKTLHPGQQLNLARPLNWLNVKYQIVKSKQEKISYKTIEETSDSMYTNQSKVTQEGKEGERQIIARITYINGTETGSEVLSEQVLSAPVDKIVVKGTKTPPKTSATSTGSGWGLPLPSGSYRISSPFGTRTMNGKKDVHYGLDMAAPSGTSIYAAKDGVVSYSGSASGYGLVVYIDHGGGVQSRYGHCSKLLVKKGQSVKKGQLIAKVGSTGRSTGPHLHFEIRVNGTPVKPPIG